jgi:Sec-independent protein translocase protein TatA
MAPSLPLPTLLLIFVAALVLFGLTRLRPR